MKAVIFAESEKAALELTAAARKLGADQVVQVAFEGEGGSADGAGIGSAADVLAVIAVPQGFARECAFASINAWFAGQDAGLVLAEPTRRLKIIIGRLAASCDTSALANITEIDDDQVSTMFFGGIALKKVKAGASADAGNAGGASADAIPFYYVGTGLYEAASPASPSTEKIPWLEPDAGQSIQVLESAPIEKTGVDLSSCSAIIACGRGFAEKDQLQLADDLASKMDAGVACSRPLSESVDWFPREAYIGVSGLMLKPKVYLGIGISGQMQHMIGVNTAGTILAINKDKDAPIFKQCDCGIVGTLEDVLPALIDAL